VHAALVAGLFPKVLSVDRENNQIRAIGNNQQVFIHPSSVNSGCKLADFGTDHISFFTLMYVADMHAIFFPYNVRNFLGTPRGFMLGKLHQRRM
jgi:ATP-dependent RNA helicase DHX29